MGKSSPTESPIDVPITPGEEKTVTDKPTSAPSRSPTNKPTSAPTPSPTNKPTSAPTQSPKNNKETQIGPTSDANTQMIRSESETVETKYVLTNMVRPYNMRGSSYSFRSASDEIGPVH